MPLHGRGPRVVTRAICDAFIQDKSGLCDGSLQTSDQFLVPVSKPLLAARFPFFKSLFFIKQENAVAPAFFRVPATKNLIEYIIEFSYSNDCELLLKGQKNVKLYRNHKRTAVSLRPLLIEILALMNASHQLDISPLKSRCKLLLISFAKSVPCTICTILEEVCRLQSLFQYTQQDPFKGLLSSVISAILQNPDESLLMSLDHRTDVVDSEEKDSNARLLNVADLGSSALAKIIDQSQLNQQKAFEVLYYWVSAGCMLTENPKAFTPLSIPEMQRWECAREFVKRLALVDVSSAFLAKCVGPTKLVADEQMSELYRTQLLRIEERKIARKERKRRLSAMENESGADDTQETSSTSEGDSESTDSESENSSNYSDTGSESNDSGSTSSSTSGSDSDSDGSESEGPSDDGSESKSGASESDTSSESGNGSDSEGTEVDDANSKIKRKIRPHTKKRRRVQSD